MPGLKDLTEVDLQGRRTRSTLCPLHPEVRAFWTGLATDLCKSYDIDGILFFNENNGPLLESLGASHAKKSPPRAPPVFASFTKRRRANAASVLSARVMVSSALINLCKIRWPGKRPGDGYFVEFWRLLSEYPEIMAWDRLFDEGKHQILAEVKAAVKAVRPGLQAGFHIEHVNSFNPIFRATRSYAELAAKANLLKIVVYNNCGGERYANFIKNVHATVFRDVPPEELLRFNNHLLNYGDEAGMDGLAQAGLSADYVFRETQRALAGVRGKCKILPGIDIGLPTGANSRKATPEDTYAATAAGLKAGANGLLYSRKYSEMRLANLAAAGQAMRDFKG